MYEETVKWESRYLCGPRLAAELTGAAKAAIANKKRGWLSQQDCVMKLLRCLRESVSEPALPEISNQLKVYFKQLRRRRGESMAAFCVRHREEYARTCKALTRVMRESSSLAGVRSEAWHSGRRAASKQRTSATGSWSRNASSKGSGRGGDAESMGGSQHLQETQAEADGEDSEDRAQHAIEDQESQQDEDWTWEGYDWWSWDDSWWWSAAYGQQFLAEEPDAETEDDEEDFIEILPDPVKGWLLLEKAGIDHLERSLIQSEVKNKFSLQAVESALRSHFTDEAIKKKDGEARHSALYEDDDDWEEGPDEEDQSFYENLDEDSKIYYQQARQEEQEAKFQIQQGRQTLREARAKQHDVRLGRKFYDWGRKGGKGYSKNRFPDNVRFPSGKGSSSGSTGRGGGPCARCGQAHDTGQCPKKSETENKSFEVEEHSEFIYSSDQVPEALCWTNIEDTVYMSTNEVVREGFGVLDGGATRTMASIYAIQQLQEKSHQSGKGGLSRVDLSERPTFGFGNSDRNQCVSTCYYKLPTAEQSMSLKIHALDKGSAPVLVSVDTLRKMGAIVDFRADQAVFTQVNPNRLVNLRRSSAGHQLIPLTDDFMSSGRTSQRAIKSLHQVLFE